MRDARSWALSFGALACLLAFSGACGQRPSEEAGPPGEEAAASAEIDDAEETEDVGSSESALSCVGAGQRCHPFSTICCGLMNCTKKAATTSNYCCRKPGGACNDNLDCCGFTSCVSGRCQCQRPGRSCRSNSECCSGSCSGHSTGTIGVCR